MRVLIRLRPPPTTLATSALKVCTWPTATAGATSQAPMQGARMTRTSLPIFRLQFREQLFRARHGAGQRVADPHGDGGRRRLAVLHHVEVRVEGRDLVHFGQRHLHFGRESGQMRGGEVAVFVLNEMQVLDQEIAPARPVGQESPESPPSAAASTWRPFGVCRALRPRPPEPSNPVGLEWVSVSVAAHGSPSRSGLFRTIPNSQCQ